MSDAFLTTPNVALPDALINRTQRRIGKQLFIMRAFKTSNPAGLIWWAVSDQPDPTAGLAPFPAGDLNDIVTTAIYDI